MNSLSVSQPVPASIFANRQWHQFFIGYLLFSVASVIGGGAMIGISQEYKDCSDDCVEESCTAPCGESSCSYQCRCGDTENTECEDPPTYTDNWELNHAGVAFLVIGLVSFFISVSFLSRSCAEARRAYGNSLAAVRPYGYSGSQVPFGANQQGGYAAAPYAPPMQVGYQNTAVNTTYPQPYNQNQYVSVPSSNAQGTGTSLYFGSQPGLVYPQQPGVAPAGTPVSQAVVLSIEKPPGHY